jgi:hypothetical protein
MTEKADVEASHNVASVCRRYDYHGAAVVRDRKRCLTPWLVAIVSIPLVSHHLVVALTWRRTNWNAFHGGYLREWLVVGSRYHDKQYAITMNPTMLWGFINLVWTLWDRYYFLRRLTDVSGFVSHCNAVSMGFTTRQASQRLEEVS